MFSALVCLSTCLGLNELEEELPTSATVRAVGPAVVEAGWPLMCTGGSKVCVESPLAVVIVLSFLTASFS